MTRYVLLLIALLGLSVVPQRVGEAQPGGGGALNVGSSPVNNCSTPGFVLYNNSGVLGCEVVAGTGTVTSVTLATPNSTLTLGGTNPITAAGTINADVNLGHANVWTAQQTFAAVQGGVNVQAGTTYTTAATDCGKTLLFTSGSAVTVTIAASIAPASGTACVIAVIQGGASKVSVNGSAVSAASLVSANAYTGTSGTAGAIIDLVITTVSATATAYLTGTGS